MSEPTTAVCSALAAGLCAVVVVEMGVTPSLLSLGFLASTFGLLIAKTGNAWWHDMLLFPCAMVGSAVLGASFGPVLANHIPGLLHADTVITLVVGILFQPIFNTLFALVPAYIARRANSASGSSVPVAGREDK